MNRCTVVHGSNYLAKDQSFVRASGKPNAAGLWMENHKGDFIVGGIAVDVTDIHSVDAVAEELRRHYGDPSRHFLNLTFVNERRRQLGLSYIAENELPHTV